MIDREHIERLRKNRDWLVVEEYIQNAVDALDRLPDTTGMDDATIALEVKSRKHAAERLRAILQPFVQFQERPDREQEAEDKRRDAGL